MNKNSSMYGGSSESVLSRSIPCGNRQAPNLSADHLLFLTYYIVFRASVSILRILELDLLQMCHDDCLSPFTNPTGCSQLEDLPSIFHPAILQRTVPHHATSDVFSSTSLRDNMLMRGRYHKEYGKLCTDLIGN